MTDTSTGAGRANSLSRILGSLAALGEATAADLAQHAGIGYSTTTPKLRELQAEGRAERFRSDTGHTLWRLTTPARTDTATEAPGHHDDGDGEPSCGGDTLDAELDGSDTDSLDEATDEDQAGRAPNDIPAAGDDTTDGQPVSGHQDGQLAAAGERPAPVDPPASTSNAEQGGSSRRRSPGSMRAAILDVFEAHPDRQYKVGELCKLIDLGNEGTGAVKASQGAVYNAATKLAGKGTLTQTVEKPATFQLTARTD